MKRALLDSLQQALNRYVGESSAALELVAELEGRSLAVHVEGLAIDVLLGVRAGVVTLERGCARAPTVSLRAAPLELLKLLGEDPGRRVRDSRALLEGDVAVAQRFAELLRLARPEVEEELSRWVGDVAAHQLVRAAGGFAQWLRRAERAMEMNAAEYLQEEARQLPAPLQAQAFFSAVETLRDDVERAAQRLERVARTLRQARR